MGIDHTIRSGYTRMRSSDVTANDTPMDGSTSGYTYDFHDKPSNAIQLGPEYNYAEFIFPCGYDLATLDNTSDYADTSDDTQWSFKLWGYGSNGPAELICEYSATVGTARINDSTLGLYVDTLNESLDPHLSGVEAYDNGGDNRVAKLVMDVVGYEWLYFEVTDVGDAGGVQALMRPF